MSETITYWDDAGDGRPYKNQINVGGIQYVSHDEKTVTLVYSYIDMDGGDREMTKTYWRHLEDIKREMLKYLHEYLANVEKSIKRVEEYKE